MSAYSEASRDVFRLFEDAAPVVEGLSIDEAFLDVSGMERSVGAPIEIARRLKHDVLVQVGLPVTVGVARTKFLAKVASAVAKPDGLLVVPPERELEFLHPLPVERLWGVGRVTAEKLHRHGISTVSQVADLPEDVLVSMLGAASGRQLHALAHNRDPRPVQRGRRRGSIGSQRARGRAQWSPAGADADLLAVSSTASRAGCASPAASGARSSCRLRFDDFTHAHTFTHTAAGDGEHRDDPDCRAGTARGRDPDDRGPWPDADRDLGGESRRRGTGAARVAVGRRRPGSARCGRRRRSRALRVGVDHPGRAARPQGPDDANASRLNLESGVV